MKNIILYLAIVGIGTGLTIGVGLIAFGISQGILDAVKEKKYPKKLVEANTNLSVGRLA